jgi:hypothetical protein
LNIGTRVVARRDFARRPERVIADERRRPDRAVHAHLPETLDADADLRRVDLGSIFSSAITISACTCGGIGASTALEHRAVHHREVRDRQARIAVGPEREMTIDPLAMARL